MQGPCWQYSAVAFFPVMMVYFLERSKSEDGLEEEEVSHPLGIGSAAAGLDDDAAPESTCRLEWVCGSPDRTSSHTRTQSLAKSPAHMQDRL